MKLLISNRSLPLDYAGAEMPPRIHIVPRGELVNKEAGITQVLDDTALNSILADLKNRHAQKGGLYMGEEHFIYDSGKSSQAFAWGKDFGLDDKGIWATAYDPTDVGAPAIKNQRFKFTSFCADPDTPGALENLGNGRVRVMKIDTVGFTNYANGKSLLTPIFNRNDLDDASREAESSSQTTTQRQKMKNIAVKLGLDPNTDEQGIIAAISPLLNRGGITAAELKTLRENHEALKNRNTELETDAVAGILAERKITDAKLVNRLAPILTALKNRADRLACLDEFGFQAEPKPAQQQRVLNRGGAAEQVADFGAGAADGRSRADKLKNRAGELKASTPNRSFDDCWNQALRELATKN